MSLLSESINLAIGILLLENPEASLSEFKKRSVFEVSESWNDVIWEQRKKNYFIHCSLTGFKKYLKMRHFIDDTTNQNYIR